ncbi:ABC transporter permease subunit [Mycoplasma todarodis]|uniref:ABC transporter permease subunit n=1 Tax=Mycoplasma todarodis TaxID=1937191 RepID=UPI003B2D79A6
MRKFTNIFGLIFSILITYMIFSAITQNWSIFFDGLFSSFDGPLFIEKLLTKMTIIILISTAMLILKKVGIFDVAAPGKFLIAILCIYLSSYSTSGSGSTKVFVGCIVGIIVMFTLSGAILALKVRFNVNEVAFGLMFNFIALFIYKAVMGSQSSSVSWMDNFGNLAEMGKLTNFHSGEGELTVFIIPAIIIPILVWFFFRYTPTGMKIIIVGEGEKLAKTMGVKITKKYFIATFLSSSIMVLALLAQLFSKESGQLSRSITATPSIVWTGIAISLIITSNPFTIYAYSFIFAMVYRSTTYMQAIANIDPQTIDMITGILMISVAIIPFCIKKIDLKVGHKIEKFESNVYSKIQNTKIIRRLKR